MAGLMTDMQQMLLQTALLMAVPTEMDKLRPLTPQQRCEIAKQSAGIVAQHSDDLQAGGDHCAQAFTALARGLAAAALTAPGGIDYQGQHWCTVPGCRARRRFDHADDEPVVATGLEPITTARQVADVMRDLADYLPEEEAA
ncbi:hypothetical protein ACH4TX_41630 [Streptomyces sp. NPDC021098]|uniref:hypothetical protein n=1 Tax=unclassified Streptomyces TaxID=2593676 RepID=UPI0037ACEC4C